MSQTPERSASQKLSDNFFGGTPHNFFTSDRGVELKALSDIASALDKHQQLTAQQARQDAGAMQVLDRTPTYLPTPEVTIDLGSLADAQYEVAHNLSGVLDAQRELVRSVDGHTPLFRRMITNQGINHEILRTLGNQGQKAYEQREGHLNALAGIGDSLEELGEGVALEGEVTRQLLQQMLSDIGEKVVDVSDEIAISRMGILQGLYQIRSTYLQAHEQQMLAIQRSQGIQQQILDAISLTEKQKESRHLWQQAELLRLQARTLEDFERVFEVLQQSHEFDPINPATLLSLGTVHSTLGHAGQASYFFASADAAINASGHLSSYTLMNLANSLRDMGRLDHAERVMRKASRADQRNPETWFAYARIAWAAGKHDDSLVVLKHLLRINRTYYMAQMLVAPELTELCQTLSTD